ncbi:MAG: HAD family hydrolase [Alphaproteobacteria bacterium]|nr:HAD family hydrolase [Alphaproteobacteria bacterium]MCL2505871.1 HAD family hydrolase [Alphaproteobacteria bacterium]
MNSITVTPCSINDRSACIALYKAFGEVDYIFVDNDGCFVPDSEGLHIRVFKYVLDKYTGKKHDLQQVSADASGFPIDYTYSVTFPEKYGFDVPVSEAVKEHVDMYNKLMTDNKIVPNPVIAEALRYAKKQGKFVCILSNALPETIEPHVNRWTEQGILPVGLFDAVYTHNHEYREGLSKADFIKKVCAEGDIPLERTLHLDDNLNTIDSMLNAGTKAVLVINSFTAKGMKNVNYSLVIEMSKQAAAVICEPSVPMQEDWKEYGCSRCSRRFTDLCRSLEC